MKIVYNLNCLKVICLMVLLLFLFSYAKAEENHISVDYVNFPDVEKASKNMPLFIGILNNGTDEESVTIDAAITNEYGEVITSAQQDYIIKFRESKDVVINIVNNNISEGSYSMNVNVYGGGQSVYSSIIKFIVFDEAKIIVPLAAEIFLVILALLPLILLHLIMKKYYGTDRI